MGLDHYMDGAKDNELIADLRCEIERLTDENKKMRGYLVSYGVTEETLEYWLEQVRPI